MYADNNNNNNNAGGAAASANFHISCDVVHCCDLLRIEMSMFEAA